VEDEAAGRRDDGQRQQVTQQEERVFVNAVDHGAVMFAALEEVQRAARGVPRGVAHGGAFVDDGEHGEAEQRGEQPADAARRPGRADAVQVDGPVGALLGVRQLPLPVDADEDGEEDAGDLAELGQELERAARQVVDGVEGLVDDDVEHDHHEDLLQVGRRQAQEEQLEGFDSIQLGLDDGEDEEDVAHEADAHDEDSQAQEVVG